MEQHRLRAPGALQGRGLVGQCIKQGFRAEAALRVSYKRVGVLLWVGRPGVEECRGTAPGGVWTLSMEDPGQWDAHGPAWPGDTTHPAH